MDIAEEGVIARSIRQHAVDIGAGAMWLLARLLPCGLAARLGGGALFLAGPLLRKHRQILFNLHRVMPDAPPETLRRTARGVWRNLGAVLFEYPHLAHIVGHRMTVTMPDSVRAMFDAGTPMLLVTAHLANWEVLAGYLGRQAPGMVAVYSPDDRTSVADRIQAFRAVDRCEYVTKQEALRRLTPAFVRGRSVGLLPDVRVDSAPRLPLFGIPTPTTLSPPRIAMRLGYPMVPVRAKRLGPARFEVEFSEPIPLESGRGGAKQAALAAMCRFNALLERWISERPEEWMCTKRRWPKDTGGP